MGWRPLRGSAVTLDEHRVCFISCVNDERWARESRRYLEHLRVPADIAAVEYRPVHGAASMASGYNAAMRSSNAKLKIYLHQDTLVVNVDLIDDLRRIFAADARVGVIGVIGCRALPASGVWWDSLRCCGRVLHACEPESYVDTHLKEPVRDFAAVEAVDGLFMATQYDLPWRDDLFTDWHFYDVSQCMEFRRRGYKVALPNQERAFWCAHCPTEKPLARAYNPFRDVFLREYGSELHPDA